MNRLAFPLLLFLIALTVGPPGPASAREAPPGCSNVGLRLDFTPDSGLETIHRNGDQLELGASVRNDGAGACTFTATTITLRLPDPDGGPGPTTVLAAGAAFRGGAGPTALAPRVPYAVDLADGVFRAPITLAYEGTWHGPGGDLVTAGSLTGAVAISRPEVRLSVAPDVASGPPPLTVRYSYSVRNVSPTPPTPPDIGPAPGLVPPDPGPESRGILTDDLCGPPTYRSGDLLLSDPAILDPGATPEDGEEWRFDCVRTFERPGRFTNRVEVVGGSSRDGRPWPATTADSTVTVLGSDLTVAKSHGGDFTPGVPGEYAIKVTNAGTTPTVGEVRVADRLPGGLIADRIAGPGWSCALATLTCARSDPLPAGNSYPPVTVTVTPRRNAPKQVTNVARVAGGGELPVAADDNSASDPTSIRVPASPAPARGPGFRILKVRPRAGGSAAVRVRVARAGRLRVDDAGRPNLVRRVERRLARPRTIVVRLRPTRALKRKLRRAAAGGRKAVRARVRFTFRRHDGTSHRLRRIPFRPR